MRITYRVHNDATETRADSPTRGFSNLGVMWTCEINDLFPALHGFSGINALATLWRERGGLSGISMFTMYRYSSR